MAKQFKLSRDQIIPIAMGHGGCFATDMITVEGHPVRWMYRDEPHNPMDSGWRFFAGFESAEYINDRSNTAVYDVNTIANYDRTIIPLLSEPIGSAFERQGEVFVAVERTPRVD
ncbi:MAG: DUF2185 domain-containing protein [Hyphomonadaceae bacterium]|nr:DUF2185 domain-containing protein [Hyphomonadaceae bacterium]